MPTPTPMKPDDGAENFPTWKLRFSSREDFNFALHYVCPSDIGHADMILTYNDQSCFNTDRARLINAQLFRFIEELP